MNFPELLASRFPVEDGFAVSSELGEITLRVPAAKMTRALRTLRDDPNFQFAQLTDLCGVDYSQYANGRRGLFPSDALHDNEYHHHNTQPEIKSAPDSKPGHDSETGPKAKSDSASEAGVVSDSEAGSEGGEGGKGGEGGEGGEGGGGGGAKGARFAVVYHLLSLEKNRRLRIRVSCPDDGFPALDSVCDIWPCANWFEREAFDLFGIVFHGHPDLRRILTDYGFIGHPFRKDFPLSGTVEMRYDPARGRVVYQPVSIAPREETPRIVREPDFARDDS